MIKKFYEKLDTIAKFGKNIKYDVSSDKYLYIRKR